MKKWLLVSLVIFAVLIVGTTFVYLLKTGKLGIGADSANQIYTISGKSTDPKTKQPIVGATIVAKVKKETVKTKTDKNGNYTLRINAEPNARIALSQKKDKKNYSAGVGNSFALKADNKNLTHNFAVGNPPFDIRALAEALNRKYNKTTFRQENTVSGEGLIGMARADTTQDRLEYLVTKEVNGVIYATYKPGTEFAAYAVNLDYYADKLSKTSQHINNLKTLANTPPTIYMVTRFIDWNTEGFEFLPMPNGYSLAFLDESTIANLNYEKISIATGYVLDYVKGFSGTAEDADNMSGCLSIDDTRGICPLSSDLYFETIGQITYSDPEEAFVNLFAGMMPNDLNISSAQARQTAIIEYIKNILIFPEDFSSYRLTQNTEFDLLASETDQNNAMYAYKFVAKASQQPEFFPGEVLSASPFDGEVSYGDTTIEEGKYMNVAYVSFILTDHNGSPMEKVKASLCETRDGTINVQGKALSIKGTCVKESSVGEQTISLTAPSYYPVPFAGKTENLTTGSNLVEAEYRMLTVQYIVAPETYPSGTWSSQTETSSMTFAGTFKTENGSQINGLKQKTIPRYPSEGTINGLGTFDSRTTNSAMNKDNRGNYKNLYFHMNYLLGGDDKNIFPVEATLKGPAGIMAFISPLAPPIKTLTKTNLKGDIGGTIGVMKKTCDYISNPNLVFPNMCR